MLADTPTFLKDRVILKQNITEMFNTNKGINALTEINAHARRQQVKWMLEKAYNQPKYNQAEEEGGNNEENSNKQMINVYTIRSIGYIKECLAWNGVINADRISAMNMVMLYDEALNNFDKQVTVEQKIKTLAQDDFFNRLC